MTDVIGDWIALTDVGVRMGVSVFTLPAKSIINVKRVDGNKVLVEVGPRYTDWKHKSFLVDFERV